MTSLFGPITLGRLTLAPGSVLLWLLAGLLAGYLAGKVVRGRGFGCLGDILLGLVGAVVGALVVSFLPLQVPQNLEFWGTLVVAFVGALILAAIGRLIGGRGRRVVIVRDSRPPRNPPYA
ncbi:MAG TPA: GlsB/YeaQ/YmgE family stress response membrane protein [Ktedonobacterales bacterium]|jgi:uncharacterized membrane protein YeaQ/YmgE (transglycosylase-associated protein family)